MGIYDRPYMRGGGGPGDGPGGGSGGRMGFALPRPTKVVKTLLIINLTVFVAQLIVRAALKFPLSVVFGVTAKDWWQVWRYVTFQFLHSPESLFHIALNMLGLYMFGTPLEQHWGRRRFLKFYLSCGVIAGLAYVVIGAICGQKWMPLIGASGGVYAILLACAVLFPHFRIILFLFPVPIRLGAVIIFGAMILMILNSLGDTAALAANGPFWSHVAHLGGAGAAAVWIWLLPPLRGAVRGRVESASRGAWQRKIHKRQTQQEQIDRILDKIRREGIGSLTAFERRRLQEATRHQRDEDQHFDNLS